MVHVGDGGSRRSTSAIRESSLAQIFSGQKSDAFMKSYARAFHLSWNDRALLSTCSRRSSLAGKEKILLRAS